MNTFIWILQGLLAAAFMMAGLMKATTPKAKLEKGMPWAEDFSAGTIIFIGLAEVAGAVGLILPMVLDIPPILTVVAAFALTLLMLLSEHMFAERSLKMLQ